MSRKSEAKKARRAKRMWKQLKRCPASMTRDEVFATLAPLITERGTVNFVTYFHEPWCPILKKRLVYKSGGVPLVNKGECGCNPDVELHRLIEDSDE